MPSLYVFRGPHQGLRFELTQDEIGLGRDAANTIQLHDTEVSRRHAEIHRRGKKCVLTDLGSSNGTFVNGQRIDVRELANGDHVQMGRMVMLFTGISDESTGGVADKIDILPARQSGDRSRIVHTLSQAEGSRLLSADFEGTADPWLARARSNLQVMYRTALAVSHTLDIDQLLDRIMQLIFEWVEADRGCIMLVNPDTGGLEPKVRRNRKGVPSLERIAISKTILDYVMEHNEGVLTSDAQDDDRWNPAASILQMGICEAICAPLQGRYNSVGVIYIDTSTPPQRAMEQPIGSRPVTKFTEEHLKLMVAIAHQAALAVEDTRYYSAMVQAERLGAVGQAIASLSHHVKNILQGIRASSFLIKDGLTRHDEDMIRKGWEFVERNQERISNLVMDMLTFSKDREPELVPADMNTVAAEVVELMAARAAEKGVTLTLTPAEALPLLVFDPEGLHRAVLNVVTNAIDACEPDPDAPEARPAARVNVQVEYDAPASALRVIVTDNGRGVPADQVDSIFSPFVSHKGNHGTGLGLPVSQKIIKEHGGRIHVTSEPGHGSCFAIEIPAQRFETFQSTTVEAPAAG